MNNISKKTCFPSTRKVLDFDLNGQHMRKTEVPEGNWVPGCSPDHSTIRPKILSLKSQPSPKDKSERLASRRKVISSGFHSLVVLFFFADIEQSQYILNTIVAGFLTLHYNAA